MTQMRLESARDVVKALGGVAAVAALTGCRAKLVYHWRDEGTFPPKFFVVMTNALAAKGFCAPAALWRMVQPAGDGSPAAALSGEFH